MKSIITAFSFLAATAIAGVVPAELDARQASGCYPFQDPHCCITYGVCRCKNGWFYQFNEAQGGCDPPWGVLSTTGESGLPGFCCKKDTP